MDESKNKSDVETPMIDLMKKAYFDIVGKQKVKKVRIKENGRFN